MTRQAFNYIWAEIGERARLNIKVHSHMQRHSCGYALANQGRDTRLIQGKFRASHHAHPNLYANCCGSISSLMALTLSPHSPVQQDQRKVVLP